MEHRKFQQRLDEQVAELTHAQAQKLIAALQQRGDGEEVLRLLNKRAARKRGGVAEKPGLSAEQIPILIARNRAGAHIDAVLADRSEAAVRPVLEGKLSKDDTLLCILRQIFSDRFRKGMGCRRVEPRWIIGFRKLGQLLTDFCDPCFDLTDCDLLFRRFRQIGFTPKSESTSQPFPQFDASITLDFLAACRQPIYEFRKRENSAFPALLPFAMRSRSFCLVRE